LKSVVSTSAYRLDFAKRKPLKQPHELTTAKPNKNVQELYFKEQVLDHFFGDKQTWSQRYFTNWEHFKGAGSPVFLYIGGEGALGKSSVGDHLYMSYLAKKHGGVMVSVEHRFYGKSWPVERMDNANMRYLHAEQALADLTTFYEFFNTQHHYRLNGLGAPAPWVSFGGSYPGTLAAWYRARFPHLTIGAVASSAPVDSHVHFKGRLQSRRSLLSIIACDTKHSSFIQPARFVKHYSSFPSLLPNTRSLEFQHACRLCQALLGFAFASKHSLFIPSLLTLPYLIRLHGGCALVARVLRRRAVRLQSRVCRRRRRRDAR
jgi:pimeloyl-ACP methyl ester carboxylesterase